MIESENNLERLTKTTPILKSIENEDMETVRSASEKKKKRALLIHNGYLITNLDHFCEYKPDSTKVLCIACNEPFSMHYGGKRDIDRHIKLKRRINNMKSFNINRQLRTSTIKPDKES